MPLIFVEGFETYSEAQVAARFGGVINIAQGFGGIGTNAAMIPQNTSGYGISTGVIPATNSSILPGAIANYTYFMGCALKFTGTGCTPFELYLDDQVYGNTTPYGIGYIAIAANGGLQAYRNGLSSLTFLGASNSAIMRPNQWYYLEVRYTASTTSGTVQAYVDGVQVMNLTGLITLDTTLNLGAHGTPFAFPPNLINLISSSTGDVYYDDIYVISSAASPTDTFFGPVAVEGVFPNNIGDLSQMNAVGTTPNFNCVNTVPPMPLTNDPNFIQTPVLRPVESQDPQTFIYSQDATDLYQFADLSRVAVSPLKAVRIVSVVYGSNNVTFGEVVSRSGVQWTGGHLSIKYPTPQAYTAPPVFEQILATDPTTSAAWTISNFNATQIGMHVIANFAEFGATATVTGITGGVIHIITVTYGGSGYITAPHITIIDNFGGRGATASATLTGDAVSSITVTAGGLAYTFPAVLIDIPPVPPA